MSRRLVALKDVRETILNSREPFAVDVVKLNRELNTGGDILTLRSTVLAKFMNEVKGGMAATPELKPKEMGRMHKDPQNFKNFTLLLWDLDKKRKVKIHWPLIVRYNGLTVKL